MELGKLGAPIACAVLLIGSFVVGVFALQPRPATGPEVEAPPISPPETTVPATAPVPPKAVTETKLPEEKRPAPTELPRKPLTPAEASRLGEECIGQRVTWTGKWISTQSAPVGRQKGTQHIFETPGDSGAFSFDHPFIAEDPTPWQPAVKGENLTERKQRRWGATGVVTVTGTVDRLTRLMFIGRGTREQVPVLTDIKITIGP